MPDDFTHQSEELLGVEGLIYFTHVPKIGLF